MHVVVRKYANAGALGDALAQRHQEVRDIIGTIPGFVAYYAVRNGDTVATISVFQDRQGTQESTRRAGEWVRQNVPGGTTGNPEVTEGETFIQF